MAKLGRNSPPVKHVTPSKLKSKSVGTTTRAGTVAKRVVKKAVGSKPAAAKVAKAASKKPLRAKVVAPVLSAATTASVAVPRTVGRPSASVPPTAPVRRSTYVDAVALYELGVHHLQSREFSEADRALRAVIAGYPEEKELHERARLYLRVCERHVVAVSARAETAEDRIFAATLAINNGMLDHAVGLLSSVIQKEPESDHASYMLGVALALKGQFDQAIHHLGRAMSLNPENRDLAFKEPDLEPLRRTDEMRSLLAAPAAAHRRDRASSGPRIRRS
jgi:tetratricopeptide (TPR) repeat protein